MSVQIRRGTRAQVDARALANALIVGQPGLITDEGRMTVATAVNVHVPVAKQSEIPPDQANPLSPVILVDDFITQSLETGETGNLAWSFTNGTIVAQNNEAAHPGVILRRSAAVANTTSSFYLGASTITTAFNFSEFDETTWIFRQTAVEADSALQFGIFAAVGVTAPAHGLYLEKLATDTNWFFVARNNGVQTRVDSGVAKSTSWIKAKMRRISATSAGFSINGGAEVVINTNAPDATDTMMPGNQITPTGTTVRDILIDFFSMKLLAVVR